MRIRLLAVLAVLALVGACTTDSGDGTTTTSGGEQASTTGAAPTSSTTTVPPTTLPPGTEELPEEIRVELAELISITQDVRQLEFLEQPNVVVVSSDELAQRVSDLLQEDLEDLPADQALYDLLGLIEPELELAQLYDDLYSEQVAGFYDGEVGELVVPRAEEGFTALQRATLVHELTHALTDQHFDFNTRYMELLDTDSYDEAAAMQSLIEGDAVLAELLYIQGLDSAAQAEFFSESFEIDQEVLNEAPRFIQDSLLFPYESGFLFVDRLNTTGGLEAVGQAYGNPPVATEQVLHPDRYPDEAPVDVELEPLELDGFELEYESTWGEQGFALMFDQVLSASASDTAAGGWGGDHYQVHFDGEDVVLLLRYTGDEATDAEEMASTLAEYVTTGMDAAEETELDGGTAYRGNDHAWIHLDGADVMFVASTSSDAFDQAVGTLASTTAATDPGA